MNLLPIGKHSKQLLDASRSSSSSIPAPTSWVKVGGAPPQTAAASYSNSIEDDDEEDSVEQEVVPIKAPPVSLHLADFPSLSSTTNSAINSSSSGKSVTVVLKPKKAPKKERMEDLLRKIETSSLASSVKKNKV